MEEGSKVSSYKTSDNDAGLTLKKKKGKNKKPTRLGLILPFQTSAQF